MPAFKGPSRFRFDPENDYYSQFSSQETNFEEDIHSLPPQEPPIEDAEFCWILATVFVVVFFLVLLFGLSLQLIARAVLRHNQNMQLKRNVEQYFKTQRHSRAHLIRSISQTYPVKDDDTLQFIQFCHCHCHQIAI